MFRIFFDASELERELQSIVERAGNIRPHAPEIHQILQDDIQQRFDEAPGVRETAAVLGGVVWESLSDAYLRRRPDREGGQQLIDTQRLRESFTLGDRDNIASATDNQIEFGSDVVYAAAQDERRPIAFFHEDLTETVADSVAEYVLYGGKANLLS